MSLSSLWIRTTNGYVRADQITDVSVFNRARPGGTPPHSSFTVDVALPATAGDQANGFAADTRIFAANLTSELADEIAAQLVTDLIDLCTDTTGNVSVLAFTGSTVAHFRSPQHYRNEHGER